MSYQTYLSEIIGRKPVKGNQSGTRYRLIALIGGWLFLICSLGHATDHLAACSAQIIQRQIAPAVSADLQHIPKTGWQQVQQFPDFSASHWPNYHAAVWYKIQWKYNCPQGQHDALALLVSYTNMAAKVYLNQDLLWQDQSLIEPLSRSWNTPRLWSIPASAIQSGENSFFIYVMNSATGKASLGAVYLDTNTVLTPIYQQSFFKQRVLPFIGFIVNFVVVIFYLMAWLTYPKEMSYLWISLTSILWMSYCSFFIFPSTALASHTVDRLMAWLFASYTIVGCFAIWRFAERKFPRVEWGLWSILMAISLLLWLLPTAYLSTAIFYLFILNMLIFLLKNGSYPWLVYRSGKIELYCMAISHLCYIPVSLHDAYQIINHQTEFWSPYVSPLGAMTLGLILALRLYRNKKMIDAFHQTLNEKVISVTQQLSTSLHKQHQLALENTRLQERINLAHDLHDGLGASLVRSMVMVDSSKNMDKNHFLSILKLLRNDLRQVIDSGSSLSVKQPESPSVWAASLRRRFVQIFEELEIESIWQLDQAWHSSPSSLQCLTLNRVAEEALTNIIKHSQATQVRFALLQTDQQLILEIQDNGLGFDPKMVDIGLHVGLQSMQMRVQRMGGSFEILSNSTLTMIRVTLML